MAAPALDPTSLVDSHYLVKYQQWAPEIRPRIVLKTTDVVKSTFMCVNEMKGPRIPVEGGKYICISHAHHLSSPQDAEDGAQLLGHILWDIEYYRSRLLLPETTDAEKKILTKEIAADLLLAKKVEKQMELMDRPLDNGPPISTSTYFIRYDYGKPNLGFINIAEGERLLTSRITAMPLDEFKRPCTDSHPYGRFYLLTKSYHKRPPQTVNDLENNLANVLCDIEYFRSILARPQITAQERTILSIEVGKDAAYAEKLKTMMNKG